MEEMFEYIDNVNKSNIIINYEVTDNSIKIKTGDNKEITIENKESYIELLNGIISTQQKYHNLERKKFLLSKENINRKSRILMFIFLLISISLLILFPSIISSLLVLISIILVSTSQVTHMNNIMEIKKIDKSLMGKKTVIINNEYILKDADDIVEVIETLDLDNDVVVPDDEVLYLDDEL